MPRKERAVFTYYNGERDVSADPLRLQRNLYIALGKPDEAFEAYRQGDAHAANCIIDNAREVFGMVPFNAETGTGAWDEDVEEALAALWDYLEKKSPSTAGSLTSSAPTTSTPTDCPTSKSSA